MSLLPPGNAASIFRVYLVTPVTLIFMPMFFQALMRCRRLAVFAGLFLLLMASGAKALAGSARYPFTTVQGDSLHTRIYRLHNGLTVYMSPNRGVPRIYTSIAVLAGSKFDPPETTGLSHYFEHMLFKGTDSLGTLDYAKERVELQKISDLFETYRSTENPAQRKKIYSRIDSISSYAARFAIPNEYDNIMNHIGARDTNAYTTEEETVFINDIPSNRLGQWMTMEAERFRNPVMRLFHTELEAVYEEKNMNMDSDGNKLWETLLGGLFRKHPYGTQTIIGKAAHLKNPSIRNVVDYYRTYYVPNNMALCLAGDFDPDEAIRLIESRFSKLVPKDVPVFHPPIEKPIATPVVNIVTGPEAEEIVLGFRFRGAGSPDADMLLLIDRILYNRTAGLIDLNLNQAQKVREAGSMLLLMKDYSVHVLSAKPRKGQRLEELKGLLLGQTELIRKGRFPDWLIDAAITDIKLEEMKQYETNQGRIEAYVENFRWGVGWDRHVGLIDRLGKITKQEIVEFARRHYGRNYVAVYKKNGVRESEPKLPKPPITPLRVNRDTSSVFGERVLAENVSPIRPVFADYRKEITFLDINPSVALHYLRNREDELFSLYYVFDVGTKHNRKLETALDYLSYLGTSKLTPDAFKQELFRLGVSLTASATENYVYLALTGLGKNETAAVKMLEELFQDARPDEGVLGKLKADILKNRMDDKRSKRKILFEAMLNYGKYGPKSPFTNVLANAELEKITSKELLEEVRTLLQYRHHVLYYGPSSSAVVLDGMRTLRRYPASFIAPPVTEPFIELDQPENLVYLVDYDMNQAEILMLTRDVVYSPSLVPAVTLFNEYFGGGMASVVFQELRESKALAYSVFSTYSTPKLKGRHNYIVSYIGTQADKLPEALEGFGALMKRMPESSRLFESSRQAIQGRLSSERLEKTDLLFDYETMTRLGVNHDIREEIYRETGKMSLRDIADFHRKHIMDRRQVMLVLGKKNRLDLQALGKYGKLIQLDLGDLYGY